MYINAITHHSARWRADGQEWHHVSAVLFGSPFVKKRGIIYFSCRKGSLDDLSLADLEDLADLP